MLPSIEGIVDMKVFLAGATGAVGKTLVPALRERGYEVIALTRSDGKAAALRSAGAQPVVADALDRTAIVRAVAKAGADVVVHQLTGLAGTSNIRHFDRVFATTNRLRTEGTDILLEAARAANARRFIAQSYGNWVYGTDGSGLKTERDPLDPNPLPQQKESLAAIRHLEQAVTGDRAITGIALRFGSLYGPGTNMALRGEFSDAVRSRKLPIIGDGAGVWSFLQIVDAAAATIAAIEHGTSGVYNVCDDDPVPAAAWIPELARALGAKPPMHVPVWLGRIAAGDVITSMMTKMRGMSNAKARRELAWAPVYSSWRQGFWTGLGQQSQDGDRVDAKRAMA